MPGLQDSEEVIQRRLRGAAEEVRNYTQYDYVLINRELEEASARLAAIVRAERLRKARMEEQVRPILESFEPVEISRNKDEVRLEYGREIEKQRHVRYSG